MPERKTTEDKLHEAIRAELRSWNCFEPLHNTAFATLASALLFRIKPFLTPALPEFTVDDIQTRLSPMMGMSEDYIASELQIWLNAKLRRLAEAGVGGVECQHEFEMISPFAEGYSYGRCMKCGFVPDSIYAQDPSDSAPSREDVASTTSAASESPARLKLRIKELSAALRFYADPENYRLRGKEFAYHDLGLAARNTLGMKPEPDSPLQLPRRVPVQIIRALPDGKWEFATNIIWDLTSNPELFERATIFADLPQEER